MHDSDEYGILRWTLQEISNAIGCKIDDLQHLIKLDILKGTENPVDKVSFSTSLAQKNRYPLFVILIDSYGPLFYSSRMVRDEYVRQKRADGGSKSLTNPNVPRKKQNKKIKEKDTLSPVEKDTFSPSPSSSSSSSSSNKKNIYSEEAQKVLGYLNEKTGKKFKNPGDLAARFNEKYTIEDAMRVIDNKLADSNFQELDGGKFMRPATLFCKKHFDDYLNEIPDKPKKQDPHKPPPKQDTGYTDEETRLIDECRRELLCRGWPVKKTNDEVNAALRRGVKPEKLIEIFSSLARDGA